MVKTGQFTTKWKGERVIVLKWQTSLVGLHLEREACPYQQRHVALLMLLKWPFIPCYKHIGSEL